MRRSTSRKCIIRKHNAMSDETILADFDQLADHGVRLDASSLANHYAFLNFDIRTNETAVTNRAFVEIDWFNNDNPGPKSDVSDLGLANVGTIHEISLLVSWMKENRYRRLACRFQPCYQSRLHLATN